MPLVTKELSFKFAKNKHRPKCYICGRFIGVGGWYDTAFDFSSGTYEEDKYSTCKLHTLKNKKG